MAGGAALRLPRVPQPAKKPPVEVPTYDPAAVQREYARNRARREAIARKKREKRAAGIRFWFVALALAALTIYLALTVWNEIQNLFGL
jgi:hypothetical protein